MTWTYTDDEYKRYTRDTWNESAASYAAVRRNLDKFTPDLLKHAQPPPGARVLDVACGDGEPALTLARAVAPYGTVIGVDLAERMVESARANAKSGAVDNARFETMDAEKLELEDAAFDLVTCRFGLQIVTDPDAALAEMGRVLKPGGRLALTVWGPGERCPALHVIIEPMLENAEPDETGYLPTPYEMGGDHELANMLRAAGFQEVTETRVTHDWEFPDVESYFHSTLKGTPIGHSLSEEPREVQEEVLRKTRENLKKWTNKDGTLALPAECVVVSGRK